MVRADIIEQRREKMADEIRAFETGQSAFSPLANRSAGKIAALILIMGTIAGGTYYYWVSPALGLEEQTAQTFQPQTEKPGDVPKVNLPLVKPLVQPKPLTPSCTNECQRAGQIRGCASPTEYKICGQFDADPCLEYANRSCATGTGCQNGECRNSDPQNNRITQTCGNTIIEGTEICDSTDLGGQTCRSRGFGNGTLRCSLTCQSFDYSQCSTCGDQICQLSENPNNCPNDCPANTCGNQIIEGSEVCDGSNLNGQTCSTIPGGYNGGTLSCNSTCTGFVTSACTQSQCGNSVCDYGENHSNCPADCGDYILSYWPLNIGRSTEDPTWNQYKTTINELKNMGYTHAGILSEGDDVGTPLSSGRINELRSLGHRIAFVHRPGASRGINDIDTLDPAPPITLPDGRVLPNAKYLDIPNLVPSTCSDNSHFKTTDPSYTGPIWQLEKDRLTNYMNSANPQNNDIVYFGMEIWGDRINNSFPTCNVSTQLMNSYSRYTAPTEEERKHQWFNHWKNRALDLYQIVKNKNSQTMTFFYNEQLENQSSETAWFSKKTDGSYNNYSTAVPLGSGDLRSPSNYRNPAVVYYNEQFQTYNYSGSVLWISFNCSRAPGLNCDQDVFWNPRISQKIGYLGRQEGLKGIMIYPGPYAWASHGVTIEYFMAHAEALADGFVRGIDAPEISATLNCTWNGSSWSDPHCTYTP